MDVWKESPNGSYSRHTSGKSKKRDLEIKNAEDEAREERRQEFRAQRRNEVTPNILEEFLNEKEVLLSEVNKALLLSKVRAKFKSK